MTEDEYDLLTDDDAFRILRERDAEIKKLRAQLERAVEMWSLESVELQKLKRKQGA